jgi:hypothetical protein
VTAEPTTRPRAHPTRIQLQRTRGWRKPDNAVVVTRSSKNWGNPWTVGECLEEGFATNEADARIVCRAAFRAWLDGDPDYNPPHLAERRRWILANVGSLKGLPLACVCPPGPCHADVLLELANRCEERRRD